MLRAIIGLTLFSLSAFPALSQDWLQGRFATSADLCSGKAAIIEGGIEFTLEGGFAADESDCEILQVLPSKGRDAAILHAFCLTAGLASAESFAVASTGDGIVINGSGPFLSYAGVEAGETSLERCP
jgi:hypothetical protein